MRKWKKSTRSADNGACVEVCFEGDLFGVRDSKQGDSGPILWFPPDVYTGFVEDVKQGHFDQVPK